MCMYDDSGGWRVFREATRRAAKDHKCGECGRIIAKGEEHRYATGLTYDWDSWESYRQCLHCVAASQWLLVACSGYMFNAIEEDLAEHVVGEESYLRSAPLTRLVRWMRADWRDRAGNLRPVEAVREVTAAAVAAYRAQYATAVNA